VSDAPQRQETDKRRADNTLNDAMHRFSELAVPQDPHHNVCHPMAHSFHQATKLWLQKQE
jgi:hypothetical protein